MVFFPQCVCVPDGTTLGWMIINMKNTVSTRAEISVAECTRSRAGREMWQKFQLWEKQSSASQGRSWSCFQLAPPAQVGPLGKEVAPAYLISLPEGQIWGHFPPSRAKVINLGFWELIWFHEGTKTSEWRWLIHLWALICGMWGWQGAEKG